MRAACSPTAAFSLIMLRPCGVQMPASVRSMRCTWAPMLPHLLLAAAVAAWQWLLLCRCCQQFNVRLQHLVLIWHSLPQTVSHHT